MTIPDAVKAMVANEGGATQIKTARVRIEGDIQFVRGTAGVHQTMRYFVDLTNDTTSAKEVARLYVDGGGQVYRADVEETAPYWAARAVRKALALDW